MPLFLLLRAAFVFAFCISATLASADEPVARCHKVNAPVGLVIRSKPGTDGKRQGQGQGAQVVHAVFSRHLLATVSANDSWRKLQRPQQGSLAERAAARQSHPAQRFDNHLIHPDTVLSIAANGPCHEHNQSFKLPCSVHGIAPTPRQIAGVNFKEASIL